jgi:CrtC N-terminal lipocalin domain
MLQTETLPKIKKTSTDALSSEAIKSAELPSPWLNAKGLELSEQGIYHFPKDHAWHSGPTYHTNDFFEWHYFTFLGTDKKTGHTISLFWCGFLEGWNKALNRPFMFSLFAWHDTVTGEFIGTTVAPMSAFKSSGSGDSGFGFQYGIRDPDGKGFQTTYTQEEEKWNFQSFCTDKSKIDGKPYLMDVTGRVKAPGYIPMAYWGVESIGFQKLYNQNPENMYGLTYYYAAPEMEMTGKITLEDGEHEIEGIAWFEHQWGNYRNTEQTRYIWGYARFDNGDAITWRQYYGNPTDNLYPENPYNIQAAREAWNHPHPEVNRFAFIPKGKAGQYSFGPSFIFNPIKWWTSPKTGVEYPWWGELKTPKGTFFLSPTFPEQESIAQAGVFIEGALLLRKDSIDGPIVARGFCEMAQLAAYGPTLTRELPENPDLPLNCNLFQ